jgi:hypothetical protein
LDFACAAVKHERSYRPTENQIVRAESQLAAVVLKASRSTCPILDAKVFRPLLFEIFVATLRETITSEKSFSLSTKFSKVFSTK